MRVTNGKAKAAGDLAAGWAKLAAVLAAYTALGDAIEGFAADADGAALLAAAPAVERELDGLADALRESVVIVTGAAARVVAG